MGAELLFGIAGWSYEDWKDVVYPRSCEDTLRFVARHVDCLEINNTFYHLPVARHCSSWAHRTADLGTRFTAKLPQVLTHEGRDEASLLAEIRKGFSPLVESGRLIGLLAQFSWRFQPTPDAFRHLKRIADGLGREAPILVEVRHRSWNDVQALARLADLGVTAVDLDYPGSTGGFYRDASGIHGRSGIAYLRLHGRNRKAWFDKDAGRDRVYDWEYSAAEVSDITARLKRIAGGATLAVAIANNHFHGKAMKLVLQLMAAFCGGKVDVPEPMARQFPDLKAIARGVQGELF